MFQPKLFYRELDRLLHEIDTGTGDDQWFEWLVNQIVERFGTGAVSDARGEATLPRARLAGFLTARKGSRYGQLYLHDGSSTAATIEIEPDASVAVTVLDGSGSPVRGVPVGLFGCSAAGTLDLRARVQRASDERGGVRFPHLQSAMRNALRPGATPEQAVVRLLIASATPSQSAPFRKLRRLTRPSWSAHARIPNL